MKTENETLAVKVSFKGMRYSGVFVACLEGLIGLLEPYFDGMFNIKGRFFLMRSVCANQEETTFKKEVS